MYKKAVNPYAIKKNTIKKINSKLKISGQTQWTNDKLLAGEQITFGGPSIGRGYDGGVIAGDKGFGLSMEISKKIPKKSILNINLKNIGGFGRYYQR
mgnify:CR=1 FL=1